MSHHDPTESNRKASVFASAPGLVLLGFLFIAGALLFAEHRAHIVLGAFIWALLVAALVLPAFVRDGWRGNVDRASNSAKRRSAG